MPAARLKGEYEALESAAFQKECNVADEIREARAQLRCFGRRGAI